MIFWEVCASLVVVLGLFAFVSWLIHSLWRILRITIPYYRRKRQEYFRIVDPKHHPSHQLPPQQMNSYLKSRDEFLTEFDSLAPDPEIDEDEFS